MPSRPTDLPSVSDHLDRLTLLAARGGAGAWEALDAAAEWLEDARSMRANGHGDMADTWRLAAAAVLVGLLGGREARGARDAARAAVDAVLGGPDGGRDAAALLVLLRDAAAADGRAHLAARCDGVLAARPGGGPAPAEDGAPGWLVDALDAMTDEARLALFSRYCGRCGADAPRCRCRGGG